MNKAKLGYVHTNLSDQECIKPGCSKKIKQRLVDCKPNGVPLCYQHFMEKHKAAQNARTNR